VRGDKQSPTAEETPAQLDRLLERVTQDVGAHIGLTYLLVPERQVLQMTAVIGAPRRLALPWARLALAAPSPVSEAVRSRRPVWLPDQQAFASRFPRAALAFPYAVAHCAVPLLAGGVCWGALNLLWPGSRSDWLLAEQARIAAAATEMAELLRDAAARHQPVRPRDEPLMLEPPWAPGHAETASALAERFTDGFVGLDLRGRITFLTDRAAQLLGRDRAELLGTEPWDVLPWLNDPAYENTFVAALFSRQPTGFAARRPGGAWLSFLLYPDIAGISMRIRPEDAVVGEHTPAEDTMPGAPARAGTLFHLLHLAAALTEAAGVSEVAESLMDQVQPVLGADGLALVFAEEGRMRVVGVRGWPPEMAAYFDGQPMSGQSEGIKTIQTGAASFHPTNEELVRAYPQHRRFYQDMTAAAYLHLTASGGTFGCLVLKYDTPRSFTLEERAELTSLAGMIAQAMDRARLYDANAQLARGLQDGLLPRRLPKVPGLEVAARYRPATHVQEVGGDFYDLIDFGAHGAAAVIGDVQGHSVQAAALMGQVRIATHSYARTGAPPEEILARTNQLLLELNGDLFCSCLYAHIDVPRQRVRLASAGHPPAIMRQRAHYAQVLDVPAGLLLGVDEQARFQTVDLSLPPGALLALYTDGLVERPGTDLRRSIDALASRLAEAKDEPLDMLADRIVKGAQETTIPRHSDDIALLLVRHDNTGRVAR
jgi:serine phosphatase RsbU (regulator of sigma subunit)/PAS domain-containing protein